MRTIDRLAARPVAVPVAVDGVLVDDSDDGGVAHARRGGRMRAGLPLATVLPSEETSPAAVDDVAAESAADAKPRASPTSMLAT